MAYPHHTVLCLMMLYGVLHWYQEGVSAQLSMAGSLKSVVVHAPPVNWEGDSAELSCTVQPASFNISRIRWSRVRNNHPTAVYIYNSNSVANSKPIGDMVGRATGRRVRNVHYLTISRVTENDDEQFSCNVVGDDGVSESTIQPHLNVGRKPFNHTISVNGSVVEDCAQVHVYDSSALPVQCEASSRPGVEFEWSTEPHSGAISQSVNNVCVRQTHQNVFTCRGSVNVTVTQLPSNVTTLRCTVKFSNELYTARSSACATLIYSGFVPSPSASSASVIIGAVVAAVVIIGVAVLVFVYLWKKPRKGVLEEGDSV